MPILKTARLDTTNAKNAVTWSNVKKKNSGWIQKKALAVVIIIALLLGFEVYAIAIGNAESQTDLPENYGNFQRNRDVLEQQAPKERFSFAIVGDTQVSGTFEILCDKLRDEPLSFMVILGDFVEDCRKENHDYFRYECIKKYRLPFPVFLVTGNREVAYDEREQDINKVSLIDFEEMYGKPNFSFEYNGCLFIGLCILPPPYSTRKSIDFLESTLVEKRKDNQKVFVFMHMPPVLKPDSTMACCENVQELVDIISKNKVDYVISAHYHGYRKTEYRGTVYLVSGGGGGDLDETETFGDLHHAIVLTVDHESVSEKVIFAQRSADISNAVKHFAVAELYPFFVQHPVLTIAENLVMICIICFATLLARKRTYSL